MKRLLTLSLVIGFILLCAGSSLAAVHNLTGDFATGYLLKDFNEYYLSFEGWYYIDKDEPSQTTRIEFTNDSSILSKEYFQNDQTFLNLTYYQTDSSNAYYDDPFLHLKGSCLFPNNFFIGLDTGIHGDYYTQFTFSPGYRFNLDDNGGYIAASLDFAVTDDYYDDFGIIDYDIYGRYYTDQSRLYGQLIIPNDAVAYYDYSLLKVGGAYQYSDHIVFGFDITKWTDYLSYFEAGCSGNFDRLGAEFRFKSYQYDNDNYTDFTASDLNILYSFASNIRAGFEYIKYSKYDDPALMLKAKYTIDNHNSVILTQRFENDTYNRATMLYWDIKNF